MLAIMSCGQLTSRSRPLNGSSYYADWVDGTLSAKEKERWHGILQSESGLCDPSRTMQSCAFDGDIRYPSCTKRCRGAARYVMRLIADGSTDGEVRQKLKHRYRSPRIALNDHDRPRRGAHASEVLIFAFSDFQCPHCRSASIVLEQVFLRYSKQVGVVHLYLPLAIHPRAFFSALAAEAARKQNKFWEYHDSLFHNQELLEDQDLRRIAQEIGLDIAQFDQDFASSSVAHRVKSDIDLASNLHIVGTPTIYINGVRFEDPLRSLQEYIQEEIGF